MKNNLNGYESVMRERNVGNYINKWTEWDKAFKADLQAAETRKEKEILINNTDVLKRWKEY